MFSFISLALSTNLRAFFTYPCSISLQNAFWSDCFFVLNYFFSLVWIVSHSEISSSSFPCFHHSILLFKYLTRSLCFYLSDGFWSSNGRNTWSMWIATGSHLLQPLKSPIRWDTSSMNVFPAFPLGICPPLMTSLTKNPHPPSQKFFSNADLPRLLRLLPGL